MSSKRDESQAVSPRARRCSNRAAFLLSLRLGARRLLIVIIVQHLRLRLLKDEVDNHDHPPTLFSDLHCPSTSLLWINW